MAGLGIKLFQDGVVLTATEVNGYLMDQTVCVFENETARNDAFGGANEPTISEGRVCYLKNRKILQYYNGSAWVDSEQFSVSLNSQVSAGILQPDRLVSGTQGQLLICGASGVPTYVTLTNDATITQSGTSASLTIGANAVALGTDTTGNYVASLVAGTGVTLTNNSGESATPTIAIGQDVASSANPTFAGTTSGSVQVGITADNEIDTTSGNLILDSTGGTVTIDDILSVSGSAAISGAASVAGLFTAASGVTSNGNVSVTGSISVSGNVVSHAIPEAAASLTNAIDGKIVKVSSGLTLATTGGSWTNGTQFTIINTSAAALTITAGTGTTFLAAPLSGSNVKLRAQYSTATFIYEQGTGWYVIGDLTST